MEEVESGAALAWRVLAALEGGALLAGGAALLVHRWRCAASTRRHRTAAKTVLMTDTKSLLGVNLVRELQTHGYSVTSLASEATEAPEASEEVDALVVIGASPTADGLNGLTDLVTRDVYDNLKLLESQIHRVRRGGLVVWAGCTSEAVNGAFSTAYEAFDNVLKAQLEFIANGAQCEAVWVGRVADAEHAARLAAAALLPSDTYPIWNMAVRLRGFLGRWLKIIS